MQNFKGQQQRRDISVLHLMDSMDSLLLFFQDKSVILPTKLLPYYPDHGIGWLLIFSPWTPPLVLTSLSYFYLRVLYNLTHWLFSSWGKFEPNTLYMLDKLFAYDLYPWPSCYSSSGDRITQSCTGWPWTLSVATRLWICVFPAYLRSEPLTTMPGLHNLYPLLCLSHCTLISNW